MKFVKMKKTLKILIAGLLIISMTSPLFATSVGDGSAFITKSEFDRVVDDFNTRLNIFEAGINSKIDSQVTTYLDRNGIWSKKDQGFQGNTMTRTMISDLGGTDSMLLMKVSPGAVASPKVNYDINLSSHYIGKIDKSGLCFMEMVFKPEEAKTTNLRRMEISWSVVTTNLFSDNSIYLTADILKIDDKELGLKQAELTSLDKQTSIDGTTNTDATLTYIRGGVTKNLFSYTASNKTYDCDLVARIYVTKPYVGSINYSSVTTVATAGRFPNENERFLNKFFVEKGDNIVVATRVAGGCFSSNNVELNLYTYAGIKFEIKKTEVY